MYKEFVHELRYKLFTSYNKLNTEWSTIEIKEGDKAQ